MFIQSLRKQWRIIRKRKVYYFINVMGLALGLASSILILLWIADEMGHEKMHEQADQIMQVHKRYNMGGKLQVNPSLPMPLAPALQDDFPEVLDVVRVVPQRASIRYGESIHHENDIAAVDLSYFSVFSFSFVKGDPSTAFRDPQSMVITEEKAEKYFGDSDPLGMVLNYDENQAYTISGVIENIDQNTSLDFDILVSFESIYTQGSEYDTWYDHFIRTYILMDQASVNDSLDTRITSHIRSHMPGDSSIELLVCPIRQLHLHDPTAQSPRALYVYIFSVIGFLVLLIACINFTNVSTFVSLKRSREIGVRKINGGSKQQLVYQFFSETFQQSFLGFLLAMVLVELLRPQFNLLTGKSITIPYLEPWFFLSMLGILLLTTLLAGSYPALLISAFKPVDAFRGRIISGRGQARFRTSLLVFQFTISVGLIITTLTIFSQLKFMQNTNLGFEKENLVYLSLDEAHRTSFNTFREELLSYPGIKGVCRTSSLPSSVWNVVRGLTWEGLDDEDEDLASFAFLAGDEDLIETLGLEIITGRGFSRDFPLDSSRVLVNEEAAKLMGFEDPVGRAFVDDSSRTEIIGLFKNFYGLPLTEPLEPMIITPWTEFFRYALIRLRPGNPEEAISHLEKVWTELYPDIPLDYDFMDERINQQYRSELRIGKLSGAFTMLAILITCIGLFAIAGHSAQKKNKEIGIRKAMGASGNSIVTGFVLSYIKWVGVANLVAWPLAMLFLKNWLNNFAHRTSLSIIAFVVAALVSALISILTVAWHAWNTSRTNPVIALKCES